MRGTGCAVSLRDLRVSAQSHFSLCCAGWDDWGLERLVGGMVERV